MSSSATPATQSEGRCHKVPRLPRKNAAASQRRPSPTRARPRLPRKVTKPRATKEPKCLAHKVLSLDAVLTAYRGHAKLRRPSAAWEPACDQSQPSPSSATPATQSDDPCHRSATPATQSEGGCHQSATPATHNAAASQRRLGTIARPKSNQCTARHQ